MHKGAGMTNVAISKLVGVSPEQVGRDLLTPEQRGAKNAKYRKENRTPEQREARNARQRDRYHDPELIEANRARLRKENRTPEQIEAKNAGQRNENLTPEQIEARRARERIENMTPEQIEVNRARDRNKYHANKPEGTGEQFSGRDAFLYGFFWVDDNGEEICAYIGKSLQVEGVRLKNHKRDKPELWDHAEEEGYQCEHRILVRGEHDYIQDLETKLIKAKQPMYNIVHNH